MRFAALLSGGKDSCYNIVKCIEHGHELVCLVNLYPAEDDVDELHSFMYQSAAHTAIPLLAQCFGVPLIRQKINGSSACQTLEYEVTIDDEVEDLLLALEQAKKQFPCLQGVACGAIISKYQRFRVEHVCRRLGLQSIAYLWERDRTVLLREMLDAGIEAVLVKVAGAGLDPHKHLGKDLKSLYPTLQRLHAKYGLDLCGEGGEYESLVLDCPAFHSLRLQLLETEILVDAEDSSVGNLRVVSCICVPKEPVASAPPLPSPPPVVATAPALVTSLAAMTAPQLAVPFIQSHKQLCQTSLMYPTLLSGDSSIAPAQLRQLFSAIDDALQRLYRGAVPAAATLGASAVYIHLYISSNSLFEAINREYSSHFGRNPPSRSCVTVPLPPGVHCAVDILLFLNASAQTRQTLHVQSVSEWAPQCIGPYSQANTLLKCIVLVAGQIALNPATMLLWPPNTEAPDDSASPKLQPEILALVNTYSTSLGVQFCLQLALCCKNTARILTATRSSLAQALSVVVYVNVSSQATLLPLRDIIEALTAALFNSRFEPEMAAEVDEEDEEGDALVVHRGLPIAIVGVLDLPRNALVEIEVIGGTTTLPADLYSFNDDSLGGSEALSALQSSYSENCLGSAVFSQWPLFRSHEEVDIIQTDCAYTCSLARAQYTGCLAAGVCEVRQHQRVTSANYEAALGLLFSAVHRALQLADMRPSDLLSVKIYYSHGSIDSAALHLCAGRLATFILQSLNVPLILVPVVTSGDVVCTCVYLALNTAQLNSEVWIRDESMR